MGEKGTILNYSVRGGAWNALSSGTTANLESAFGIGNGADFWVVGDQLTLMHCTGLGQCQPPNGGTSQDLTAVSRIGDGLGFGLWVTTERSSSLPETRAATKI